MRLLDRLERKLGRYGVPNVTLAFVVAQVVLYLVTIGPTIGRPDAPPPALLERASLIPAKVLEGEVWRLVTFLAVPPLTHPIFAPFFWYLFWLMGTALERHWGAFRYNLYLLVGYVATVAVSFLIPDAPSSNAFLQGSVFLAFAFLNPDFELSIFFVLPVKIKWLALLTWLGYAWVVLFGDWLSKLLVVASVLNFLLFFGAEIAKRTRYARRRMARQAEGLARRDQAFHRCTVCGITDKTHPDMDFRYCTECKGSRGYCTAHIKDHAHVTAAGDPPSAA